MTNLRASDLIRAAFDVTDPDIYVERDGNPTRGTPPPWYSERWPSHTAADMGPPWVPPAKRGKA